MMPPILDDTDPDGPSHAPVWVAVQPDQKSCVNAVSTTVLEFQDITNTA